MSLIHWWPLNGDTKNYGTSGEQVAESNVTYTSGKIGQAMYKGQLNFTAEQWKKTIGNTISIAMWIYTRDDGTYSAGTPFFGNGGMTKPNNRKFTMFHYPAKTTLHCSWQNDDLDSADKPNTYLSITYANFFEIGKWVHLCVVQDAVTETVTIYRNGTQYSKTKVSGLATMNFKSAAAAPIRNNIDYQHMNDLRIYDHALSQAEVKEISKALVIHYTFDDICAEPTTNIITGIKSASGKASLESGRVKINWSPSGDDSYFFFNYSQAIKANSVYTLSFDCEGLKSGEVATFAVSNLSAASYNIALKNGRNSLTFTAGSDLMNDINTHNRLFFDDKNRTNGAVFYLSNFQLEERDHATPYTPISRDSFLHNEAGLSQPTEIKNLQLTTDAAVGSHAFKSNSSYIVHNSTGDGKHGALASMWIKTPLTSNWIAFVDYQSELGFGCYTGYGVLASVNRTNKRRTASLSNWWKTNEWNHVVVTMNSTHTVNRCWINGVEVSYGDPDHWTHSNTSFVIGSRYNGKYGDYLSTVKIDDFRLYYTYPGDDKIEQVVQDLYKTKASVTDKGDMETHQFIEGCANLQITHNGCAETYDVQELGNSEYTPIEYIASTGSQYIDTKYYWTNEKATIVADLEVTTWKGSSTIFGSEERYSGSNRYFAHILHAGSANGNYANYIGQGSVATTALSLNTRSKIEYIAHGNKTMTTRVTTSSGTTISANKVSYAGTILTRQHSTQTAANRGHIYIFSNHNAYNGTDGIQKMAAMKLYRFTMYDNDICVRDFIPCKRNKDGAAGLFDNVTGEFYLSPNNVAFTAGPTISLDNNVKFISGKTIQARNIIEI